VLFEVVDEVAHRLLGDLGTLANSACAFSGLNDTDPTFGQTVFAGSDRGGLI
jgi:hypothetical protein